MKKEFFVLAAAAAFGAGAHAFADSEDAQATLDSMERTGEIVDCLQARDVDHIYAVDDSTFLIKSGVSRYYVTETSSCSGATHPNVRIEHISQKTTMCKNDILTIYDNLSGAMRGTCSVGSFEKLGKKTQDAKTQG